MVVCFKMLFKLLLRDAHSFSRAWLSENCGLRGTDIFRKIETVVFLLCVKYSAIRVEKMFTNSGLCSAWNDFSWLFSGTT